MLEAAPFSLFAFFLLLMTLPAVALGAPGGTFIGRLLNNKPQRSGAHAAVERFAKDFKRSPDQLNQDHLRPYQAYVLRERKLEPRTVKLHVSALRFFIVKALKRTYLLDDIPYPKVPPRLPTILTVEEVGRLIDGARTGRVRTHAYTERNDDAIVSVGLCHVRLRR